MKAAKQMVVEQCIINCKPWRARRQKNWI